MKMWLAASAAILVTVAGACAQLGERKDVDIFGREAAQQRAPGISGAPGSSMSFPPTETVTDAYSQTLTFRNGRELHGTFLDRNDNEIFWQRPDASEVLRIPRSEVLPEPAVRMVRNELFEQAPPIRVTRSKNAPAANSKTALSVSVIPSDATLLAGSLVSSLSVVPSVLLLGLQPLPSDLLVFKDGDELSGRMLSATAGGPLRWRTTHGQEVEFQTKRVAGIRLGHGMTVHQPQPGAENDAMVELRTGERVRGRLLTFDGKQLRLQQVLLGTLTLERARLWRIYPDAELGPLDGGRSPTAWKWVSRRLHEPSMEALTADGGHWIYLDGTYLRRGRVPLESMPIPEYPGWQHPIDPRLERFEFRFEIAESEENPFVSTAISFIGGKGVVLCIFAGPQSLNWVMTEPPDYVPIQWHQIPIQWQPTFDRARSLRMCVDTKARAFHLLINGQEIAIRDKREKGYVAEPIHFVRLQPHDGSPIFSNIWIGPWSGELPVRAIAPSASITLRNGDTMPSAPESWDDGKWTFGGELGPAEISSDKISIVDFGGQLQSEPVAGRVRLVDGSSLDIDTFQWDGHGLTAHSASAGNVHVEAGAISELLFDPAIPRPSLPLAPSKAAGLNIIPFLDGRLQARQ